MRQLNLALYIFVLFYFPFNLWQELTAVPLSGPAAGFVVALLYVPLWLLAYGIIKDTRRSYILLCFLLLFYFAVDVTRMANGIDPMVLVAAILQVVLFTTAMLHARKMLTQSML